MITHENEKEKQKEAELSISFRSFFLQPYLPSIIGWHEYQGKTVTATTEKQETLVRKIS